MPQAPGTGMLRPVTSSLRTSNPLKKANSQAKSIPLGCTCPSYLSHSHSPSHARRKPKPWAPSCPCSATAFRHPLGQVPQPQGTAMGSSSRNPSRQAAQSQAAPGERLTTSPNLSASKRRKHEPRPPFQVQAVAWAKQKGRSVR